jgi:hypothetical protein
LEKKKSLISYAILFSLTVPAVVSPDSVSRRLLDPDSASPGTFNPKLRNESVRDFFLLPGSPEDELPKERPPNGNSRR